MATASSPTIGGREVSERLSRCVATLVFYEADRWSWSGAKLLWEEARALRTWANNVGLGDSLDDKILTPTRAELYERYGPTAGDKLHAEFVRALHDAEVEGSKNAD